MAGCRNFLYRGRIIGIGRAVDARDLLVLHPRRQIGLVAKLGLGSRRLRLLCLAPGAAAVGALKSKAQGKDG